MDVNPPSGDQHFLLNFIMSTFLGPDAYSDNPRCSAAYRLAKGLPPYTSNNLGDSFLRISELGSLYYYALRNAHPSLVLNPNMLYLYLKGKLHSSGLGALEDYMQFTSFFPLSVHGHKRYSASHEIVKGIVLIENPDTSYMKTEDLERFKYLSGLDSLAIDIKKCLSYEPGSQKGGEETEQIRMPKNSDDKIAGTLSSRNKKPPAMFQQTYKRRRVCNLPVPAFHSGASPSKGHNKESSTFGRSCKSDGPATMVFPKFEDYITDESVILTGTARSGIPGPPIAIVDIGISEAAYFFQVALPGVRTDSCELSCEIESDGKVHIQGWSTSGGKIIKKRSRVFHMKFQQMCPPGPFTVSFNLPGPVDPRLFSPKFRTDGIFEAVIIKQK